MEVEYWHVTTGLCVPKRPTSGSRKLIETLIEELRRLPESHEGYLPT